MPRKIEKLLALAVMLTQVSIGYKHSGTYSHADAGQHHHLLLERNCWPWPSSGWHAGTRRQGDMRGTRRYARIEGDKSSQVGLFFLMRFSFHGRCHVLSCFSLAIASLIEEKHSKWTSLCTEYRAVKEFSLIFVLCSRNLLTRLLVTPIYRTLLLVLDNIYV